MADKPVAAPARKPVTTSGRARRAKQPASTGAGWDPLTQPIDKAHMGGKWTPGILEIIGASSPRNWEEVGGYGMSGALLIYRGWGLSHFSLVFWLWEAGDWADWNAFKPLVMRPPRNTRPRSIDISHPLLEDLQIRSVVVEDLFAPEQAEAGVWRIEVRVIAFREPKRSLAKLEGGTQPAPLDDLDLQLKEEAQKQKELMDALAGANGPQSPPGANKRGL
jgi:hypothetical protein